MLSGGQLIYLLVNNLLNINMLKYFIFTSRSIASPLVCYWPIKTTDAQFAPNCGRLIGIYKTSAAEQMMFVFPSGHSLYTNHFIAAQNHPTTAEAKN